MHLVSSLPMPGCKEGTDLIYILLDGLVLIDHVNWLLSFSRCRPRERSGPSDLKTFQPNNSNQERIKYPPELCWKTSAYQNQFVCFIASLLQYSLGGLRLIVGKILNLNDWNISPINLEKVSREENLLGLIIPTLEINTLFLGQKGLMFK